MLLWESTNIFKEERGVIAIEAALCAPIVLLMMLGGIDISRAQGISNDVHYLAQQSAACLATQGCSVDSYIQTAAPGFKLDPANLTVTAGGKSVQLVYSLKPLSPFFSSDFQLSATATTP